MATSFIAAKTVKGDNINSYSGSGITYLDNVTLTGRSITGGTFGTATLTAPTLNAGTVPTTYKLTLTDLPVSSTDAANKAYVDSKFTGGGLFSNTSTAGVMSADLIELQTTVGSGVVQWQQPQFYVTTTTATPTTGGGVAVSTSGSTAFIKATVVAHRTGGTGGSTDDGGTFEIEGYFKNSGGTVTQVGSSVMTQNSDQSTWAVSFAISSTTVNVQVTGAANNNVSWYGSVVYLIASV
jgi:hypothetical protein